MYKKNQIINNQKGQGLVEYLIIIALVGVATIGIMRVLGQNLSAQFANITYAIQGSTAKAKKESIDESNFNKKDMGDFMNGAASK